MSKAAMSMLVFGVYLIGLGGGLLVGPNLLLGVFGFSPTGEVWLRVVGMLLLILSFYYIAAARSELRLLFLWTVYGRASVILFFTAFVALGLAKPVLIAFGAVDLLGATWTGLALRSDAKSA